MADSKDLFDLKDRVIVATGGGGVLVGHISKRLAEMGARIAILNRTPEKGQRVADEIRRKGGKAIALSVDVTDRESVERAREIILEHWERVDALINGAGGNHPQATTSPDHSFFDLPVEAMRTVFDVNFMGTVIPSQVFGRVMAEQGQGVIINVSSMNAFRPLTRIPAYSAAKAAVSNFTQWLAVHMAQEYSPHIRVNAIAPGFFLTQQNRFLLIDEKTGDLTPRGKTIIDHTPMGRFGAPEDLIGAVVWLLSDASAFVTGVVIPIDGGFSAFSGV